MNRHLVLPIVGAVMLATPAVAAPLSGAEKVAYACVIKRARAQPGNPLVAASSAAEKCSMGSLNEAQKEKVVGMATRRLMRGAGQRCIGTGCG